MKDLSLHLSDILENSAKAGAGCVWVWLDLRDGEMRLRIEDDGPGFPEHIAHDPTDPLSTTRTERRVGLGLGLLRQTVEQAGGCLVLDRSAHGGVLLDARYVAGHIDAPAIGDLTQAICSAILSWNMLDLVLFAGGVETPILDTREVKRELDGVPLHDLQVMDWIGQEVREGVRELQKRIALEAGRLIQG